MSFSNSLKIIQIIKDYYDKGDSDYSMCPPKLTRSMLLNELCIVEPDRKPDVYSLQQLWNMYCFMNNNTNSFGFKYSPTYEPVRVSVKNMRKISNSKLKNKYNVVFKDKRPSTIGKRASSISSHKRTSRSRSRLYVGGNNLSKTLEVVEKMNDGTLVPSWYGGWTTLIKLKDVAGTKLYINGTSIPKDDEDECRDTFLYYKYIKGVNKIISLHGCNLNWTRGDGSQVREPKGCDNKEMEIWEALCREYNESLNKKGRVATTRHPCDYEEYHWIDMDGGYFDVYDKLSQLEFTQSKFHTLIHCLGGLGRTGTALLLIICKYYYRNETNKELFHEHFGMNETDTLEQKRRRSNEIMNHLENEIFSNHVFIDSDIPSEFIENSNSSMVISPTVVDRIKRDLIASSPVKKMKEEIFTYFYKRIVRGGQISLTCINTFITRVNNIIYFTAKINNIDGNITLYNLYGSNNQSIPSLNRDNSFVMKGMVFIYPTTTTVADIDLLMSNPATTKSSHGFEVSRLPYFSYISDAFIRPTSEVFIPPEEEIPDIETSRRRSHSRKSSSKKINMPSKCIIS
jgi:hypothetical protein